jgi:hypothetical protein
MEHKMTIDLFEFVRTMGLLALVDECVMLIKLIQLEFDSVLPRVIGCIKGKGFSPVPQGILMPNLQQRRSSVIASLLVAPCD